MAEKDQLTGGLMIKASNGNAIQNPLDGTANKPASEMKRYAGEFGMMPREISPMLASRSGLNTAENLMADVAAKPAELVTP